MCVSKCVEAGDSHTLRSESSVALKRESHGLPAVLASNACEIVRCRDRENSSQTLPERLLSLAGEERPIPKDLCRVVCDTVFLGKVLFYCRLPLSTGPLVASLNSL